MQAALFGSSLLLFGVWAMRAYGGYGWVAVAGSLVMLVSASLLPAYFMAWSEALFILLAFAGYWMLARYMSRRSPAELIGVGIAARAGVAHALFRCCVCSRRRPWGDLTS